MNRSLRRKICTSLTVLLTSVTASTALAADHNDAPDIMGVGNSKVDITDVYATRSPSNPSNLFLYLGIFSPEVEPAGTTQYFATNATYSIFIDTDGDFLADVTINTTFQNTADGGQTFTMTGVSAAGGTISGPVSTGADALVVTDGPVQAFTGLRDDNFFFDLTAFQMFTKAPCIPTAGLRCAGTGAPQDFFANRNVAAISVELPLTSLPNIDSPTSGSLNVWAKTFSN